LYDCTFEEDEDGERRRAGDGVAVGVGQYEETPVVAGTGVLPGRTRGERRRRGSALVACFARDTHGAVVNDTCTSDVLKVEAFVGYPSAP
jgi:hypothetical protein